MLPTTIALPFLSLLVGTVEVLAQQPTTADKKFPCDPKFDEDGNYIEITVGSDPTDTTEVYVCFGEHRATYTLDGGTNEVTRAERDWYDDDPTTGITDAACLRLSDLPGREKVSGFWTAWSSGHTLDTANRTYQFAMCGTEADPSVWEDTQRHLSTDAWDFLRLYTKSTQAVEIASVRVVQNRVRILDDAMADEGDVDYTLDLYHSRMLDLSWRIRNTKLRRLDCLNGTAGLPRCDTAVTGLDYQDGLPPVLETALLELGHSGSAKYLRNDDAWCSEFALYVIQQASNLSRNCPTQIPDPLSENITSDDMRDWFSACGRLISNANLKSTLQPGDYISLNGLGHSAIFIGWVDPVTKAEFWEISGNNECAPELENTHNSANKSNIVCITKRTYSTEVLASDIGGRIQD